MLHFLGFIEFMVFIAVVSYFSHFLVERFFLRYKIPSIIGYLFVGVLVGPYFVNIDGWFSWFSLQSLEESKKEVYLLGNIALGFLIVTSFVDIKHAERLFDLKASVSYIFGSVVAFFLALLSAEWVLRVAPGLSYYNQSVGEGMATILVFSLAVVVTSVPFLTKIFIDLRIMGTAFSSTVLLSACFLDILIWAVFPVSEVLRKQSEFNVVPVFSIAVMIFIAAGLLYAAASYVTGLYEKYYELRKKKIFGILFVMVMTAICAAASSALGAGVVLGMLIAGLCLGRADAISLDCMPPLRVLAKFIFIPAYFIIVGRGLVFDVSLSLFAIVVFILWSSFLKISAISVARYIASKDLKQSLTDGVVFNTRGGPGLVLATVAYSMELINVNAFSAFVAASIVTAPVTEFLLRYWLRRSEKKLCLGGTLEAVQVGSKT